MWTPSSHTSPPLDAGVGVGELHVAEAQALDLAAAQHDARPRPCRGSSSRGGRAGWTAISRELAAALEAVEVDGVPWERSRIATGQLASPADVQRLPCRRSPRMVGQAYDCYPEEACGLLAGHRRQATTATVFYPCANADALGQGVHDRPPRPPARRARRRGPRLGDHRRGAQPHPHRALPEPDRRRPGPRPAGTTLIVSLKREAPETCAATGSSTARSPKRLSTSSDRYDFSTHPIGIRSCGSSRRLDVGDQRERARHDRQHAARRRRRAQPRTRRSASSPSWRARTRSAR